MWVLLVLGIKCNKLWQTLYVNSIKMIIKTDNKKKKKGQHLEKFAVNHPLNEELQYFDKAL